MRGCSAGFSRPLLLLAGLGLTTVETWMLRLAIIYWGKVQQWSQGAETDEVARARHTHG